jgi:PKD repeat protein
MGKAIRFSAVVAAAVAAAVLAAACTVHQASSPSLTGPSELALSLNVTATPDSISLDGSQSSVVVEAHDATGAAKVGVSLRLDIAVGGTVQDCGTLSARNIVTGTDGRATTIFTAPTLPLPFPQCSGFAPGNSVTIIATPSGSNAETTNFRTATIRLMPTGVILPPAASPTAAFTVSPTPATAASPLHFDASTSLPGAGAIQITSFNWSFGDGTTGTGVTPTHTYTGAGSYTVTLTVTNDRGLSASTTQTVAVGAPAAPNPPSSVFTFSPQAPGVNETVFFNGSTSTAASGHTIASYKWTFGDGGTATGVTVSHAFATAGTYVVQLTVTDEAGQSATSAGTSITAGAPPGPTSNFTFSPTDPARSETVVFDASTSSTSQGQTITNLAWNFGDGTPIVTCPGDSNCNGTRIISHVFTTSATFVVNLVVTDSAGRTASHSTNVPVGSGNPNATFTTSSGAALTHTVNFNAGASSVHGGASITDFSWNFGDGVSLSTGTTATTSHNYATNAPVTVTLTVTDSLGRKGVSSSSVTPP